MEHNERIPVMSSNNNLKSYEEAYQNFNWQEVESAFTWHETGNLM